MLLYSPPLEELFICEYWDIKSGKVGVSYASVILSMTFITGVSSVVMILPMMSVIIVNDSKFLSFS